MPGKDRHTKATKVAFEQSCKAYGIVKTDWQFVQGETLQTLSRHARYSDAVVMSQANVEYPPNSPGTDPDLPAKVAMASARPVICVPFQGHPKTIGRRILIAWDDSREASRAVTAALPFLRTARMHQYSGCQSGNRQQGKLARSSRRRCPLSGEHDKAWEALRRIDLR